MKSNYQNIQILLNENPILATNASLDLINNTETIFKVSDFYSDRNINSNNSINSSLKFSYFLRYNDPLFTNILNHTYFDCSFGGIILKSGILKSLNLEISPINNIQVDAEINFWHKPEGSFIENQNYISGTYTFFDSSNITFTNLEYNWDTSKPIYNLKYNLENSYDPKYNIPTNLNSFIENGLNPININLEGKIANISFETDFWDSDFKITGDYLKGTLNFCDSNGNVQNSLFLEGKIISRNININNKDSISNSLNIVQTKFYKTPSFSNTNTFNAGSLAYLDITDIPKINSVILNNKYLNFSTLNNLLFINLPENAISGNCTLKTSAGDINTNLKINPSRITISDFNNKIGFSGDNIIIKGTNFYDITNVYINDQPCVYFEVVSPKTIFATVPGNASQGKVKVESVYRGLSVESAENFTSYPIIDYFSPSYNLPGNKVFIYGRNFSSVSAVKFNNIDAGSFLITNDYNIEATVPTNANNYGPILLEGPNEIKIETTRNFKPSLAITSVSPNPVDENSTLTLNVYNLNQNYLYLYDKANSKYGVLFPDNQIVPFSVISSTQLQGTTPKNFIGGMIYLIDKDGASIYPSGYYLNKTPSQPILSSLTNSKGSYSIPFFTTLKGDNLEMVTGLWLKSVNTSDNTSRFYKINSSNFYKNPNGKTIDIVNYSFPENITASFDIEAVTSGEIRGIIPSKYRINLI